MNEVKIEAQKPRTKFTGNILLFYAFDVGDDIDLQEIKNKVIRLEKQNCFLIRQRHRCMLVSNFSILSCSNLYHYSLL